MIQAEFSKKTLDTEAGGYNTAVKFNKPLFVCEHTLISNDTISPIASSGISANVKPVPGFGAIYRLIGDGSHSPTFSGFKKLSGSEDYDTTLNAVNLVTMFYDGADYWYSIAHEATE